MTLSACLPACPPADKLALDGSGNSVHPYIAVTSGATQRFGFVKMSVNRTHLTLDAIPVDWNYNSSERGGGAAAGIANAMSKEPLGARGQVKKSIAWVQDRQ